MKTVEGKPCADTKMQCFFPYDANGTYITRRWFTSARAIATDVPTTISRRTRSTVVVVACCCGNVVIKPNTPPCHAASTWLLSGTTDICSRVLEPSGGFPVLCKTCLHKNRLSSSLALFFSLILLRGKANGLCNLFRHQESPVELQSSGRQSQYKYNHERSL